VNYFAKIFEDHIDASLPIEKVGDEFTFDLALGY
jgi:hypothetical protein